MKRLIALIGLLALASPAQAADSVNADDTSILIQFFVSDSSSTTGAGLTGLAYNTGSLSCYYHRSNSASATAITLATMTLGTWATGGFVAVDGTNMPGWYQMGVPDAAFAAGARDVSIQCKGATNMAPMNIHIPIYSTPTVIAGSLGTQAKADVNAEVVDTLNVDTYTELTSCPAATASFKTMLQYLYMVGRNKWTQTISTGTLFRDDGSTGLCTFTDSDSAGTTTRGEGG